MSSQESHDQSMFQEAASLYKNGNAQEAFDLLTALNSKQPDTRAILYAMALCLRALGRLDETRDLCIRLVVEHDDERARSILDALNKDGAASCQVSSEEAAFAAPTGLKRVYRRIGALFSSEIRATERVRQFLLKDPSSEGVSRFLYATHTSAEDIKALRSLAYRAPRPEEVRKALHQYDQERDRREQERDQRRKRFNDWMTYYDSSVQERWRASAQGNVERGATFDALQHLVQKEGISLSTYLARSYANGDIDENGEPTREFLYRTTHDPKYR